MVIMPSCPPTLELLSPRIGVGGPEALPPALWGLMGWGWSGLGLA